MDVEAVVSRWLADRLNTPCYVDVPEDNSGTFMTVERTGGGGSMFEEVFIDVDCWADKRKQAQALSDEVKGAVADLDEVDNIFHPQVETIYKMNDPDTGKRRYVVSASFFVCE